MTENIQKSSSLILQDLECVRGEKQLFCNLNSELNYHQCLHVTGANGTGKTSLLRIISGLAQPDSGQVLWDGTSIKSNHNYFSQSAYIGHKDALKNELSAIENLRFYQQFNSQKNATKRVLEDQLDDCLDQLSILNCADLLAQQLSFGQRRRLSFAKLLLHPYEVWILDEPFTGIDIHGRSVIEALCTTHLNNGGMIVLTHHQHLGDSVLSPYLRELSLGGQYE